MTDELINDLIFLHDVMFDDEALFTKKINEMRKKYNLTHQQLLNLLIDFVDKRIEKIENHLDNLDVKKNIVVLF